MKQKITLSGSSDRPGSMVVKKLFYVLTIGVFIFAACKKDNKNVEQELIQQAENDSKSCICDPVIDKFKWNGRIVYARYVKGPLCNSVVTYFNSNGKRFDLPEGVTFDIFRAQATFIAEIWSCTGPDMTHQ